MKARMVALTALTALAAACGDDPSPAEPSDTTPSTVSVTYAGTLTVGASRFYSFTNSGAGTVTALLASVTSPDTKLPIDVPLEVGIGIPAGTDCATTSSQVLTSGLVSQMSASLAAGVFCLRVSDAGEMHAPVSFAVRFSHP